VGPHFGTEMCNALCEYNSELEQDKTYFKEKSELYTYFSRLGEDEGSDEFGVFYKIPFTNYLRSLNGGSQADHRKSAESKKDPRSSQRARDNFFRTFFNKFSNNNTAHMIIIAFIRKAFYKALKNQEDLTKSVVEKVKTLINKMKKEKLDLNESYDLIFTVLADILHCSIKFWRIEDPIGQNDKNQYIVSSYGTDTLFRSHLAFLKMNIADDNKLLILYQEALNDEMGFKPRNDQSETLKNLNMRKKPKVVTNNYLDYFINRCKKFLDKPEDITSLLEEIKTYSESLAKKLDTEEFRKFIVDLGNIQIGPIDNLAPEPDEPKPKCINQECEKRDDLIKFECGNCYICQDHGEE